MSGRNWLVPVGAVVVLAGGGALLWSQGTPVGDAPTAPAMPTREAAVPEAAPKDVTPETAPAFDDVRMPTERVKSGVVTSSDPVLDRTRSILMAVVEGHARDPQNPWAIGHGLMVYGSDMTLSDDRPAIPFLFEEYARPVRIGEETLIHFPRARGDIRIEPHTDLLLKFFSEVGLDLDTSYMVSGEPHTARELYRSSLHEAWVDEKGGTGFEGLVDSPWGLQGLAAYAPADLEWTAKGGREMTMDTFTNVSLADLFAQTRFMADAKAQGTVVAKRRQGIFSYSCGGAHSIQGAGFAVARGFGSATARQQLDEQIELLFWRVPIELAAVDDLLPDNPEYAHLLLNQRLKFLGHFLETTHKFSAMGLFQPDEGQRAVMTGARDQLVATVGTLDAMGILGRLDDFRANPQTYQLYLDYVGDSAHAVRAIDLSTGADTVLY